MSKGWSISTAIKDAADALRKEAAPPVAIVLDPVDFRRFVDEIADESVFSAPDELVVGGTADEALVWGRVQFYGLSVRSDVAEPALALQVAALETAAALDRAERHGAEKDQPEGSRNISMSDTCAVQIAGLLRELAK